MGSSIQLFLKQVFLCLFAVFFFLSETIAQEKTILDLVEKKELILNDKNNVSVVTSATIKYNPRNTAEVVELIKHANSNNKRIIIRGNGHSANGSSLPQDNELVISSINFRNIQILNDSTVEVESGVIMAECQKHLNKLGFALIVTNEGGKGPSLGGYISAGGIGDNNNTGFWETVVSVTLINGQGKEVVLTPHDSNFKWVFGSMGQLGFITKAVLRIRKTEKELSDEFQPAMEIKPTDRFYWYPMFVTAKQNALFESKMEILKDQIKKECKFSDNTSISYNQGAINLIYKNFNPPLLLSDTGKTVIYGIKMIFSNVEPDFENKVNCSRDFIDKFLIANKVRSYYQVSYYYQSKENLLRYMGQDLYNQFKSVKSIFDPADIFGTKIF